MKIVSKIKLLLNWKHPKKTYSFLPNLEYDLSEDIANYLLCAYKDKFVKTIEIKQKKEESLFLRKNYVKPTINNKEILWTVGIVNYKSLDFIKHQLKILHNFNSLPFKLIIVDNSIPSEKKQLMEMCSEYNDVTVVTNKPKQNETSNQHSEGLEIILSLTNTKYLLVNDPDFFWVQKEYLYTLQKLLEEGYVCVGAPFYRATFTKNDTPAVWGCAYQTRILEKGIFETFKGCSHDDIHRLLTEGKDTAWRLREKYLNENLRTFSFEDHLGITLDNDFSANIKHFSDATVKDIHEYRYNGKIIAYHLYHACHDDPDPWPSKSKRRKTIVPAEWQDIRKQYSNFFYNVICKEIEIRPLRIHLHFLCKNEEDVLPFFFRHYDQFVTQYFCHFNIHSTDKSLEILKNKKSLKIIEYNNKLIDDRLYLNIKNYIWKEYSTRDNCDWVIICDADEFLYHPNILNLLNRYDNAGVDIPKIRGYQMFAEEFPIDDKQSQIYKLVNKGVYAPSYNKYILMKPHIFPEYAYGCHSLSPCSIKLIKFSDDYHIDNTEKAELKLFHYAVFGEKFVKDMMNRNNKLSELNKAIGLGVYSLEPGTKFNPQKIYEDIKKNCAQII